jgi:hypothetical protein
VVSLKTAFIRLFSCNEIAKMDFTQLQTPGPEASFQACRIEHLHS